MAPVLGCLPEDEQISAAEMALQFLVESAGDQAPAVRFPRLGAAQPVLIVEEYLEDQAPFGMRSGQQGARADERIGGMFVGEIGDYLMEAQHIDGMRTSWRKFDPIKDLEQLPQGAFDVSRSVAVVAVRGFMMTE
jgi:hypothetical protein